MTRDEIMKLDREELEKRSLEIADEIEKADDDEVEETENEVAEELEAIEERQDELNKELEERKAKVEIIQRGAGEVIEKVEERKITNMDVRNSQEYIKAYAEYIKTNDDTECRALLTENVEDGVLPVPALVEATVRQAWENDQIFSRVAKSFVKGNLKIGFELSATDAEIHIEGDKEPDEEKLVLGIVLMVPSTIKKWITFSTEVAAMGAADFLRYIYDELTYKIIQKAASEVIRVITEAPAESTKDSVGVAQIQGAVTPETILAAMAALGDAAKDNVIIASGATIAAIRTAALSASYAYDPFFGLTVIQKDGVTGAIVGDLNGVQANLPEGEAVKFVYDEFSFAEKDLVKVVGRLYAAIAVVGPKMLAVITGEESE